MKTMYLKIRLGLVVGGLMTILLLVGCSDVGPTSSSNVWVAPPPMTADHIASGVAEGVSFLCRDASHNGIHVETGDSLHVERLIHASGGGTVHCAGYRVHIPAWSIHEDIVVSIDVPNTEVLACDFGPHPYNFDWTIYLRISYGDVQLPEGVSPQDLELWYWNGYTQQYEYICNWNNTWAEWMLGFTDHFSRYVIATGQS
jgi:hypothetical protein